METREIMINRNGKPLFAVRINGEEGNQASYVYVEHGDIKFDTSWMNSITPYELSNESHRLAKEIFTIGLQAAVKTKIYELKQLESILKDLNLSDCLGNVMVDNTKLLLEVSKKMSDQAETIIDVAENQVKKVVEEVVSKNVKPIMKETIEETIKPIAVRKKREPKTEKV
jgi:hypothetical protein